MSTYKDAMNKLKAGYAKQQFNHFSLSKEGQFAEDLIYLDKANIVHIMEAIDPVDAIKLRMRYQRYQSAIDENLRMTVLLDDAERMGIDLSEKEVSTIYEAHYAAVEARKALFEDSAKTVVKGYGPAIEAALKKKAGDVKRLGFSVKVP